MGKRRERKRDALKTNSTAKSGVEEALNTLMSSVQTWDRITRGDERLKPIEEHPKVYPSVVIREFKKSSRLGQRWFAGMVACLGDFDIMARPLKELVLSPEIFSEVKKEVAELLSERGHPLDQEIVEAVNKSQGLSSALISKFTEGEDAGESEGKLSDVLSLPPDIAKSILREVVQEVEGSALPLAKEILQEGENPLSIYLVDLMGATPSDELIEVLLEAAGDKSKGELHKAAKKAIYRLRASGIEIGEIERTHQSILSTPEYKFFGACASLIDGEGNRMLWLARTKALGGLHLINCMMNDRKGIIDCHVYETNKKNYQEITDLISEQYSAVEIDADYCSHLIEKAAKLNAQSDTSLPEDYLQAQQVIGEVEKAFDKPLIYDHFNETEIYPNQLLLTSSAKLLEHERFASWIIPSEDMEPYNFKLQEAQKSRIVLSETSQKERIEDIVNQAADELFQAELKSIFRRRLEENAYILYKLGNQDDAKLALVAGLALDDENLPPHRHPFVSSLVKRSLTVADEESKDKLITPP